MRKLISILLLLIHVNTSMFIPVMDEVDIFDAHGMQYDDINSTYEYVDQVVLGNEDSTPEDEDDDHAREFNMVYMKIFVVPRLIMSEPGEKNTAAIWVIKPDFLIRPEDRWASAFHDIIVPPPKA